MAETNEQDPITGRTLPRLGNYNGSVSTKPASTPLPKLRGYSSPSPYTPAETGSTGDIGLYDYTQSKYDNPGGTFVEDLPNLNSIRAENQGFLPTLANGLGRVLTNVIPTVVGNVASILDLEDYANEDNEVGNSITRAMEDFKATVNRDYLPIYRENPNESFNIGDSAWWIENGSSLAESIGAFAITGAGIGAGFNAIGKGLSMINGLAKLGEAGKLAATVLSATGLNQAESITTAMQVYDTTYKTAIANGQADDVAKQNAADAASYSININRANIALNLTSAGAFIRSPNLTRQARNAFSGHGAKEIFHEGAQEYLEETLNYVAQKEGERSGDASAKGKDYKYDFKRNIDDALSAEGIEQGVLGFIGGAGQTGLTRVVNKMNGKAAAENQGYANQQESIARIQGLQNAGIVPNITNVFNNIQQNVELQDKIDKAVANGNDGEAKTLQYQLLNTQISDALENGTVDHLESVYTKLQNLTAEQAEAKGLDTDPQSPYNYKKKATEAINLIKDVEDGYLTIANKGYVNPDEVLDSHIQDKVLNRLLTSQRDDYNKSHTAALQDKLNLNIQADLDSSTPPKELTDLRSYKQYLIDKVLMENTRDKVIANNEKYNKITSAEYQSELKDKQRVKLEEGLRVAREKVKAEEDAEVKKRQKEVKSKVDKAKEPETPYQEVPLPTEEDTLNIAEAEYVPEEVEPEVDTFQDIDVEEATLEPEITSDEYTGVTPEEKAVANIVEQEDTNTAEQEVKKDGLVRVPANNIESTNNLKFINTTRQREVANTIISLNVPFVETILGNTSNKINEQKIFDTFDDEGNLIINENFDSRLQSPTQFNPNRDVKIIVPTFEEMEARGLDSYTESDYNTNENDIDNFPIAFVDSNNKIIGYLPTQSNVNKRVNAAYREVELLKNRQLRETIYNNRDKEYTVKITRKSPGSLLTNNTNKSIYNALGDGTKLANDIDIAIYKDSRLQASLGANINKSLLNKDELQSGYIYSVIPTAEEGSYIAAPMDVSRIGEDNARTVLKLLQLYKANPTIARDKSLLSERSELAREIDLSNPIQFNEVVSSIMYTSTDNDAYLFNLGKNKLSLGFTNDMIFTWDQVMTDPLSQDRIVNILSNRYHAVQLSKFGQKFNQYKVNADNKIEQVRHNNYFDYLNKESVVKTNVQGFPVENTSNEFYFTGQSVIEFSDPILSGRTTNTVEDANIVEPLQIEEAAEVAIPAKPKNKLGIKYKPKNNRQIEEDFDFISTIDSIKDLDKQAEELIKKCKG